MRRAGLTLAAVLLVPFCAALLTLVSPAFEAWQAQQVVKLTGWLDPAPLSRAHGQFGHRCTVCHQQPFVAVADAACTECHQTTGRHVTDAEKAARARARCTDCHALHAAKAEAADGRGAPCIECHARQETRLAEVRDFARSHPPFRLSFNVGDTAVRVRENASPAPAEQPNLAFSHEVHLAADGVSSPEGQTVLHCADCHRPDAGGRGFLAPDMATSCQQSGCHGMRFAKPLRGVVPHGAVRDVFERTRNAQARRLADAPEDAAKECGWPARPAASHRQLLDCADAASRGFLAGSLFRQQGDAPGCALCHQLAESSAADAPWKVAPVRMSRRWHATAWFPHRRHASVKCADCHDKSGSTRAEDVAIPGITRCRECHGGDSFGDSKVGLTCADCHDYHRFSKSPPDPAG